MRFTVVTILPELIEPAMAAGVVGRAREAGTIAVATVNPRDFTHDRHRSVDDNPYGGGPGMVMRPAPMIAAIAAASAADASMSAVASDGSAETSAVASDDASMSAAGEGAPSRAHRILLSPGGRPLTQARVRELARLPHLVLVCGRYEGIDQRAIDAAIDEEISIGDFVLSGGELGALVIIDAVARYVPGVLGDAASADDESFSAGLLEYPQYTRPPELAAADLAPALPAAAGDERGAVDRGVPAPLLTGNHATIAAWRRVEAMKRTAARRPDLWARVQLSRADRKLLAKHGLSPLHARTHLALVHHPIVDRTGAVITSAVTNFDIHDLARSSNTYGLASYCVVTPITSQREKADYIANLWRDSAREAGGGTLADSRAHALTLVRTAASIEQLIGELTHEGGGEAPVVVATSARQGAFPGAIRRTPIELAAEFAFTAAPVLILLGTGWGLAESLIPSVSRVLTPIDGPTDWNHLSVRSAGAIMLDRLFGARP